MSSEAALARVRRRLDHAASAIRELERLIGEWALDLITVVAPDGMSQTTRAYPVEPDAEQRWELMAGDVLNSLRAALDNTIYALSLAHQGTLDAKQAKAVRFPAGGTEEKWRREAKTALGLMSRPARRAVERLRPWDGGSPSGSLLARLIKLSNHDKHREMHVVTTGIPTIELNPWDPALGKQTWALNAIASGAEILTLEFASPRTDPHLLPSPAIEHRLVAPDFSQQVVTLLSQLTAAATQVVDALAGHMQRATPGAGPSAPAPGGGAAST